MKFLNKIDSAEQLIQDENNRLVTDVEKAKWDTVTGKETPSGAQTKATKALTDSKAYVDGKVKTDVPVGAKFTDTLYTHPSTHPYSMITGTPTSLPANGGHATSATHLLGDDTRSVNSPPSAYLSGGARYASRAGWQTEFKLRATIGNPPLSGTYVYLQTHTPWSDPSGGYPIQLVYGNGHPAWRVGVSTTAWSDWVSLNDGGNASTVNGKTVGINVPANAKFTDTIVDISGKSDKTYVDNKVKTDVPAGAKFTDTTTTINGKTGTIAKADIVALGIPAQDTVYTHPTSHPASMITESSTKRFVSDSEKSTWNSKSDTDTVTTINGKTGAITKADIVALGIPTSDTNTTYSEITTAEIDTGTASTLRAITGRRVKYILDKVQGWIGGLTKSDVGLSNVDNLSAASIRSGTTKANVGLSNVTNDKQMPISGGTFTGISKAQNNTSHTVAQMRNTILSTEDADVNAMNEGEIWIKYG